MKAYDIEYGIKVKLLEDAKIPPGAIPVNKGDIITICRLDGIYCNGYNADGDRIYIAAYTEVEFYKPNQ